MKMGRRQPARRSSTILPPSFPAIEARILARLNSDPMLSRQLNGTAMRVALALAKLEAVATLPAKHGRAPHDVRASLRYALPAKERRASAHALRRASLVLPHLKTALELAGFGAPDITTTTETLDAIANAVSRLEDKHFRGFRGSAGRRSSLPAIYRVALGVVRPIVGPKPDLLRRILIATWEDQIDRGTLPEPSPEAVRRCLCASRR